MKIAKDLRKFRECATKVQVPSLRPPNIGFELRLILFGTIVAQMLQVTLSSCGNVRPSTGVMLQDVCPYFGILGHVPAHVSQTWL